MFITKSLPNLWIWPFHSCSDDDRTATSPLSHCTILLLNQTPSFCAHRSYYFFGGHFSGKMAEAHDQSPALPRISQKLWSVPMLRPFCPSHSLVIGVGSLTLGHSDTQSICIYIPWRDTSISRQLHALTALVNPDERTSPPPSPAACYSAYFIPSALLFVNLIVFKQNSVPLWTPIFRRRSQIPKFPSQLVTLLLSNPRTLEERISDAQRLYPTHLKKN